MSIPWETGRLEVGRDSLYYEVAGPPDAPCVVLCHGLGGNHAVWYQQVPVLTDRYRVITWDQRGFGMSTDVDGVCAPPIAVSDLAALLDHLDVADAHLVGQSMGGWAIVGFALAYPGRVRSLVMADTIGGVRSPAVEQAWAGDDDAFGSGRPALPPLGFGSHPAISPSLGERDLAKAFLYQQIGDFRGPIDQLQMIATLGATTYDLEAVAGLDVPVLILVGDHDALIPPAAARTLVDTFRSARFVEIAGAGHSPYFERPDEWNAAVTAFLAGAEG